MFFPKARELYLWNSNHKDKIRSVVVGLGFPFNTLVYVDRSLNLPKQCCRAA